MTSRKTSRALATSATRRRRSHLPSSRRTTALRSRCATLVCSACTPPARPPTARFAAQAYNFLEEEDLGAANESVMSLSEAAKPIEVEEAYPEVAEAGAAPLDFVEECVETDASAPTDLPYWACTYCNIHSPASVVKCASTGKWFCNSKAPGLPASCIIYHLVRSKHNEVVLHKESPLGEITLECFLTGTKNVFQLGAPRPPLPAGAPPATATPSPPDHAPPAPCRPPYSPTHPPRLGAGFVPVKEDLVVLLARDTEVHSSEYDWDLTKWAPLVQEKELVQWLVKRPSDAEALRARPCNVAQINKLEELWRTNPDATLNDVADSDGSRDDSEPCTPLALLHPCTRHTLPQHTFTPPCRQPERLGAHRGADALRGRLPVPEHHGASGQARGRLRQADEGGADAGGGHRALGHGA